MIPSIGRIVHYTTRDHDGSVVLKPGFVVDVHSYAELDLVVFDQGPEGWPHTPRPPDLGEPPATLGLVVFLSHVGRTDADPGTTPALYRWNWPKQVGARPSADGKSEPGTNSIDTGIGDVLAFLRLRLQALEQQGDDRTDDAYEGVGSVRATRCAEVRDLIGWINAGEHVGMAAYAAAQRSNKQG